MKKLIVFFIFVFINVANARLVVKEWHQENTFVENGQEIAVKLKLQAQGLSKNYYHDNWTYVFDKKLKTNITEYKVLNDDKAKIEVIDNKLRFKFRKTLNGENVFLEFKYFVENTDIEKYQFIRREVVFIPKFAKGAVASILVHPIENNMEIYSLNTLFQKNEENDYLWIGNVPTGGFKDNFDMTLKQATWEVESNLKITNDDGIGDLDIKGPAYFFGGGNTIKEYNISTNQIETIDNDNIKYDNDYIYVKFKNFDSKNGFIKVKATIENTYSNLIWANDLDPNKATEVDQEISYMLNTIINEIKEKDTSNLPLYAKIARWVHDNINYDITFIGKNLTTKEILDYKKGVCSHYSILYRDMLRSINIPAVSVIGLGYNLEKKTFENHSWVLVNYNNQWIPIDPTWNLYSGKLPITHIFMYKNLDTNFQFSKIGSLDKLRIDIKNNARLLSDE